MRLLLDTHVLMWALDDPTKLTAAAAAAVQDQANELLVSAATVWELAIKIGTGKLKLFCPYRQWMDKAIVDLELCILPVTVEYADRQAALPPHHKDPFDRLLIAQSIVDAIPIVSADTLFDSYGITRLWQ